MEKKPTRDKDGHLIPSDDLFPSDDLQIREEKDQEKKKKGDEK